MDQNQILSGLMSALQHGTGGLDDLDQLLDRVKQDIARAKDEQERAAQAAREAQEKEAAYAHRITDMANRMLSAEVTAEDVALVLNAYLAQHNLDKTVEAADIDELVEGYIDLNRHMNSILNEFKSFFSDLNKGETVKISVDAKPRVEKRQTECNDADRALDSFLKSLGLR